MVGVEAGERTHVVPKCKQELKALAQAWFAKFKDPGFFSKTAGRGIVSF